MKKIILGIMLLCLLALTFNSKAMAYIEPSDNILSDEENAIYIIGWIYARITSSQREPRSNNIVYKVDLKNNTKSIFYDAGNVNIDRLILSPNNQYMSVLKGYSGWFGQLSELSVIDVKEKKEIVVFKDEIGKYIWSFDGHKIVYIAGGDVESTGFRSKGVFLYELEEMKKKKIADRAIDVQWLTNNYIYIIDHSKKQNKDGVYEINYGTFIYSYSDGSIHDKGVKGVSFSLDGKYSILLTPQYDDITADEKSIRIKFNDTKLNKEIPLDKVSNILGEPTRIEWDSFVWLKGNRIVFEKSITNSMVRDILICDVEHNKVLKTLKGKLIGLNSDRSKIVVFHSGKFEAVMVP